MAAKALAAIINATYSGKSDGQVTYKATSNTQCISYLPPKRRG